MAVTAVRLPHPVTLEGRTVREVPAGTTARELVAGWGDVVAAVDGRPVGPGDLDRPLPDGAVLVARSLAAGGDDSNPLRAVLQIALIVAGFYVAGTSWFAGLSTFWKAATSAAIVVGGTLVINAIAPPVLPSLDGGAAGRPDPVYSLVGGANRARPYEPLLLVLGTHRVFPDLGAREYTVFGSAVPDREATIIPPNPVPDGFLPWRRRRPRADAAGGSTDQFLHQIFHFGLGDLDVEDLRIGDTLLTDFEDVETQWPDAAGALTLVAGNVDTEAGAELDDTDWVSRDTAAGSVRVELDFTAQLFELRDDGSSQDRTVVLDLELTPPGGTAQTSAVTLRHGDPSPYRLTVSRDLSATPGTWRVRVRRRTAPTTDTQRETAGRNGDPVAYDDVAWTAVRSFQPDGADYEGQTRLALRIRASGQLSGRLDRLSALVHQKVPVWDPAADGGNGAWTAPRRSSNPAWIFRWYALGIRIDSALAAGVGLAAARIDDEVLKEWGAWCDLHSLTCNVVVYHDMTYAEALAAIAQTGRASPTWATGKLGVVYDRENQPATAYFGPGNIVAGSFEVDWASGAVADEIVCRYVDPDLDWQWNTVRRNVPGVSAADRTATLTLWGVTDRDQAAKACNLQAARQLYHKRRLRFRTGPEGRDVKRGAVVHVSHALVDGGITGRVLGGSVRNLRLDRDLSLEAGDMMLLRLQNGDLHATAVSRTAGQDDNQVRLDDRLPAANAPRAGTSSPLDILWRHYPASSPPLRAKVVAVEPRSETEVQIEAIDETPLYYAAATSDLTVDLPAIHRAWPAVTGIRVAERLVKAGDFDVVEIVATLDVEGDWRGGIVTASLDGGPVRAVGQPGPGELEARWVEPPEGTLRIRAVPGSAAAPAGRAHEVVHVIQGPRFPVARRPGRPAVSTVFETALVGGTAAADANAEVRALAGTAAVDRLTAANAETVTSIEIGISADADPPDAATQLRRGFLPQVGPGEVAMLYEEAGGNWAAYLTSTVPASIADGARTVTLGVSHLEHGDAADVAGACRLGFSRAGRGEDGLSRYELAIYRKRVRRTAAALALPAAARWDHDGSPEAADQGLVGRLTNTGDWSRVFPAYDSQTEEVMCSQATGRSDDTIPGGWSTPRRCESPAGINTVYRRSATKPAALPAGTARVPAGTADSPPSGAGDLWQNTGVQNAFSRNWTWDGWRRAEGLPGAVELAVYQKRTKGAADPDLPDNDAQTDPPTWDYDGTPELADKGLVGRLTNVGDWSRVFPDYDAQTEEVVCSIASGFSNNALGAWSPVRVCENPADINKVYRRSDTRPAALADGADRVPADTHDTLDDVPAGRGYLFENTGHRNALSNTWKWDGWVRLDVVDGFPAAQKNYMMTHFAQRQPSAKGYYAFRGPLGQTSTIIYYAAVNAATWARVTQIAIGIGSDAALRAYLKLLEVDDWVVVVNDQTGHVGNEPNAVAYARVNAKPAIADDADHAIVAVTPARAHPVFYTDVGDSSAGNPVASGDDPFAAAVCVGFSRVDTSDLQTEETDITAALSATAWAVKATAPAAIAAFSTPANRALAASDLPSGVGLVPPTVGGDPLWAARLTGAVSGDDVRWTAGSWGKVFDPDDLGVTVNDADFTVED